MQDTAEGFGQPIRQIFEPFFRIERAAAVAVRRAAALPGRRSSDHFWHWLYLPVARRRRALSRVDRPAAAGPHRGLPAVQLRHADRAAAAGACDERRSASSRSCSRSSLALLLAPLLVGWVNQCRAWLQNKRAPALLQPYRMLHKLFNKDAVRRRTTRRRCSALTPYIVFGCMVLRRGDRADARRPTCRSRRPPTRSRWSACSRWRACSSSLARWTSARVRHARRAPRDAGRLPRRAGAADGAVHRLADLAARPRSPTIVETLAHRELAIYPSLAFAGVAFTMVSLAENARIPVDNPATHLELTMIHEAMILEYSARHLALIEWAASLKLFNYSCIGLALFFPWGIAEARRAGWRCCWRCRCWSLKLAIGGALLALIETLSRQDAHLPRARVPRHRVPARGARHAGPPAARSADAMPQPARRPADQPASPRCCCCSPSRCSRSGAILSLINLFALQGVDAGRRRPPWSAYATGPAAPVLLGRR